MTSTPKLCPMCEHFEIDTDGMYGEYPDPLTMRCMLRHWKLNYYGTMEYARRLMLTAQTCPDYEAGTITP